MIDFLKQQGVTQAQLDAFNQYVSQRFDDPEFYDLLQRFLSGNTTEEDDSALKREFQPIFDNNQNLQNN